MVILPPSGTVQIVGRGGHSVWLPKIDASNVLSMVGHNQLVGHDVDDQVVVAQSGMTLFALNEALAPTGQCIPFLPHDPALMESTLGGLISVNLPHFLEAPCGTWRNWVIGMTILQANGVVAKTGSKAVKSVAGYDVYKLMIGARGAFGVITEVILRTYPVRALPSFEPICFPAARTIQRVLTADFELLIEGLPDPVFDRATSTLFSTDKPKKRFEGDWVMRADSLPTPGPVTDLMIRTKDQFDAERRLNPGVMGVF